MAIDLTIHSSLTEDAHFIAKDPLKLNNALNICLKRKKHYFTLLLIIRYL